MIEHWFNIERWSLAFWQVDALLDTLKWDKNGLAVGIAQHVDTGAILMQGFVDRDALSATIASRRATFYSRSRNSLWTKGETSSNFIHVVDIYLDCDRDSVWLIPTHPNSLRTRNVGSYYQIWKESGFWE